MVIERCDANLWCTVPVVAGTFRILLQSCFEGCSGRECQKQSPWFFEVFSVFFGLELKRFLHPLAEVLHKMLMLQMPTWSVPTHFKGDVLTKPYSLKGCVVLPVFWASWKGKVSAISLLNFNMCFGWNLNPKHLEVATWPSQAYSMESKRIQLNATQTLVTLVNKHTPNGWLMTIPKQRENPLDKMTSINWSLLMWFGFVWNEWPIFWMIVNRDLNLRDPFPHIWI